MYPCFFEESWLSTQSDNCSVAVLCRRALGESNHQIIDKLQCYVFSLFRNRVDVLFSPIPVICIDVIIRQSLLGLCFSNFSLYPVFLIILYFEL